MEIESNAVFVRRILQIEMRLNIVESIVSTIVVQIVQLQSTSNIAGVYRCRLRKHKKKIQDEIM